MDRRAPPPGPDDRTVARAGLALGLMLLALAGWVDAVGLVHWGGLNVSFMSGNTIQLGGSPATGDWSGTWEAASALLMFLLGIVAGEVIGAAAGRRRSAAVLSAEAALLWLAAASVLWHWGDGATIAIGGVAMGVQTAALHKAAGLNIPLTYVTGTLVNIGRGVAAALRGAAPWSAVVPYVSFWLALAAGAVAGSFVAREGLDLAVVGAAGAATTLALFAGLTVRHGA